MPWTRKQVRYLESSGSPLTTAQKAKMNAELHADPALGHKQKGSSMKSHNIRRVEIEVHRDKSGAVTGHTVQHHYLPSKQSKSGAFSEYAEPTAHPFSAKEGGQIPAHIAKHLQLANADGGDEPAEAEA